MYYGHYNFKQDPVAINVAQADLWDDTLLIKAYEDSLRLAQEKVAKRIAQSTNNRYGGEGSQSDEDNTAPAGVDCGFKVGDFVRCTFSEDGVDYEAEVVAFVDDDQCTVRYLGYNNEETVESGLLIPTWGKKARATQVVRANAQQAQQPNAEPQPAARKFKKSAGKPKAHSSSNMFYRYQTAMMIPPPPPLPPNFGESANDSEHLSAMLMSWYMSGYYTGFYQGQKESRKNND